MANIAIDVDVPAIPFPFATMPGRDLPYSAVPRGRVTFRLNDQVIAAKIATNTTSAVIKLILPANYAYVQEYISSDVIFATDVDDALKWDALGEVRITGIGGGGRVSQMFSEGQYATTLNAGSGRAWAPINPYPLPLFPGAAGSVMEIQVFFHDSDVVNACVAGLLNLSASYLQYDIEQIFNLGVNYPIPVQVR